MFDAVEQVRRLWRGEPMRVRDGAGNVTEVSIFPRPVQPELPVWLTCSGDPQMFVRAGELGLNVLTALLTQSIEEAASKIKLYREARARAGHDPRAGHVTLMMHTFVGGDERGVLEKARAPLCNYLKSHVGLVETMVRSLDLQPDLRRDEHLDDLVSFAFERYYRSGSLIGTPEKCLRTVERVRAAGVDEVACFVDFGVDADAVLDALPHLNALKEASDRAAGGAPSGDAREAVPRLLSEHVREQLSEEMSPSSFRLLDALPRDADGAVNREALAARGDFN
jgi:natural product biosynthesis luciferase-like monooxygenase protein